MQHLFHFFEIGYLDYEFLILFNNHFSLRRHFNHTKAILFLRTFFMFSTMGHYFFI